MGKLVRYQQCRCFHFVTFSCDRRQPWLSAANAYRVFEAELETVRQRWRFVVAGYVLMPEHVHMRVGEPQCASLSVALQVLKQQTSRKSKRQGEAQFWQRRHYGFNVWSEEKRIEKLRHMHRNPVKRGLIAKPADWRWSNFRHYATSEMAAGGDRIGVDREPAGKSITRASSFHRSGRLRLAQPHPSHNETARRMGRPSCGR